MTPNETRALISWIKTGTCKFLWEADQLAFVDAIVDKLVESLGEIPEYRRKR